MMRIAILGGTSQIATDFLACNSIAGAKYDVYARNHEKAKAFITLNKLQNSASSHALETFPIGHYDVVMNFIGTGDPKKCADMGASIFDITYEHDQLILNYLRSNPQCKYIFLSSGAAYGGQFDEPATIETKASFDFNHLKPQDWYAVAKFYAECRHRAMPNYHIYDVRVFNYYSHTQDNRARFLISDMINAIQTETVLKTSPLNITRDYITPPDFSALIASIIGSSPSNLALDCYTKSPIDKLALLDMMRTQYGLIYEMTDANVSINATGIKPHYYSLNKAARDLGYSPAFSSIEGIQLN